LLPYEGGIAAFARLPNSGLIVTGSAPAAVHSHLIVALAAQHKLPAAYFARFVVAAGGLISYAGSRQVLLSVCCPRRRRVLPISTCLSALVTDRAVEAWYDPFHGMNDPRPEGHMASHIGRREFLATLGGAAAWPVAGLAQQAGELRTLVSWVRTRIRPQTNGSPLWRGD
jgi:hypothetical protein